MSNIINKNLSSLIPLCLMFFSVVVHARGINEVGNGGDVVVCADHSPFTIKVLDEYESESLRKWDTLHSDAVGFEDIAVDFIDKSIQKRMPLLAKRLRKTVREFKDNLLKLREVKLEDIDDSHHIALPDGDCEIKQIINYKEDPLPGEEKYTIDEDLWDMLSETQKAILVLHEAVYGFVLEKRKDLSNSIGARYLNSLIFTGLFESILSTDQKIWEIFQKTKINYFEKAGFLFQIFNEENQYTAIPVEFYSSQALRKANFYEVDHHISFNKYEFSLYYSEKAQHEVVFEEFEPNQIMILNLEYAPFLTTELCRISDNKCFYQLNDLYYIRENIVFEDDKSLDVLKVFTEDHIGLYTLDFEKKLELYFIYRDGAQITCDYFSGWNDYNFDHVVVERLNGDAVLDSRKCELVDS